MPESRQGTDHVSSNSSAASRVNEQSAVTNKEALLKDFNRFAGGRSLSCIWESDNLDSLEKLFLLYLGHCADFHNDGYVDHKAHRISTIALKTGMSEATIQRRIKSLTEKGYLEQERRANDSGREICAEYAMTHQVFDEYQDNWLQKKMSKVATPSLCDPMPPHSATPRGLTLRPPVPHAEAPIIDPLNSCPSLISNDPIGLVVPLEPEPSPTNPIEKGSDYVECIKTIEAHSGQAFTPGRENLAWCRDKFATIEDLTDFTLLVTSHPWVKTLPCNQITLERMRERWLARKAEPVEIEQPKEDPWEKSARMKAEMEKIGVSYDMVRMPDAR